jgi:hypothetical protein
VHAFQHVDEHRRERPDLAPFGRERDDGADGCFRAGPRRPPDRSRRPSLPLVRGQETAPRARRVGPESRPLRPQAIPERGDDRAGLPAHRENPGGVRPRKRPRPHGPTYREAKAHLTPPAAEYGAGRRRCPHGAGPHRGNPESEG